MYLTISSTDVWKRLQEAISHALFENIHEYIVNIAVYYVLQAEILH